MDKNILLKGLLTHLVNEHNILITAANNARAASIDEQSVAETQYDTLAIEAGYLAEGQAKRAAEINLAIEQIKALTLMSFNESSAINMGALVQIEQFKCAQPNNNQWYFIAPAGAGFTMKFEQCSVTVITPQSPLGQSMINKYVGDDIELPQANKAFAAEILCVR
ncbi:MAG: hypothetical protein ACPG46_08505 [Thalassotalea sp.]